MNIQTPASRRNDPETSRMAERQITDSGKRQTHQRIIAAFVAGHPGHTAAEIGEKTGLGQHECAMRLSDLFGSGWQRTEDNTWLRPTTGEPYSLDEAARVNYESSNDE